MKTVVNLGIVPNGANWALDSRVFFTLLFVFQLLLLFQGVDLSDEGFLATFYAQIFHHPENVEYAFIYWLSGIFGGLFEELFGRFGIIGLRVCGILVTTGTGLIVYRMYREYIPKGILQLSIFILILQNNNTHKIINYNNLSALFFVSASYFLIHGLKTGSRLRFILSGVFVALSSFTRIPNILEIGLVIVIFYHAYLCGGKFLDAFRRSLLFLGGFLAAVVLLFLFMYAIGHYAIFIDALATLFNLGAGEKAESGQDFYSHNRLLVQLIKNYVQALKDGALLFITLFFVGWLSSMAKRRGLGNAVIQVIFWIGVSVVAFILVYIGFVGVYDILFVYAGFILILSILLFFSDESAELKSASLAGLIIMITFPVASSAGITTAGRYSFWVAMPLAIYCMFAWTRFEASLAFFSGSAVRRGLVRFVFDGLKRGATAVSIFFVVAGLYYSYYYPFFDENDRLMMRYPIHGDKIRYIYTTEGRARILNELLTTSKKYVKPGDYVLAYERIPQYHYLTETIPFLSNSLVWLYKPEEFQVELASTVERRRVFPVIVIQKISTHGANKGWPYNLHDEREFDADRNFKKDRYLQEFIDSNGYEIVWENMAFKLLVSRKSP